jgi:hypothetical protein
VAYVQESSSWRSRRRHRQQITLVVALLLLVAAGGVGYAVYSGAIGGPARVDVATLPPCPPVTAPPLLAEKVTVNVYNATRRNGIAGKTATSLGLRTFNVGAIDNDPLGAKVPGTAIVRHGPKGLAAAKLVAAQVRGATLVADKRKSAAVDLVLGAKFAGLRPLAETTPTPTTPTCRPVPTTTATTTATTTPTTATPAG